MADGAHHEVDSRAACDAFIAEHKARFPEATPAYRPSGASAPGALGKLIVGGARQAAQLFLFALVIVAITVISIAVSEWLLSLRYGIRLLILLGMLFVYCGPFVAGLCSLALFGLVSGGIERAARAAHCRNLALMRAVSVTYAVLGCAGFGVAMWLIADALPSWEVLAPIRQPAWSLVVGAGLGVAIAIWLASTIEIRKLGAFCEPCQRSMEKASDLRIDLALLPAVQATLAGAEPVLLSESAGPLSVLLQLHYCTGCGRGFVDGDVTLHVGFRTLERQEKRVATWLALSAPLGPREVTWLRDQATPSFRLATPHRVS